MSLAADVTLAVLAGGEGTRMGRPKGLLDIAGQPILLHLLDRLAWTGPTLLVTAPGREHPPAWEAFSREVTDPVAGAGPLRGILTALENATTPLVMVATVDMPAVTREMFDYLHGAMNLRPDACGVMLRRTTAPKGEIEPFPSAFRRSAAGPIADALAHGRRAVHGLARSPQFPLVDIPPEWPESVWTNLNEPAELDRYIQSLSNTAQRS